MKEKLIKILYKILAKYAKTVIKKHKPFVIAVTGSVGKSSTKEAIYKVLADHFGASEVRKNYGNLNADIGIPLTILGYKNYPSVLLWPFFLIGALGRLNENKYPKYLVLEMGIDQRGDIDNFCKIVRPDFAVITSLSGAHLANFHSKEEYQKEKLKLLDYLSSSGKGFVNIDDSDLKKIEKDNLTKISNHQNSADFHSENIKLTPLGSEFDIITTGKKIHISSPLVGEHMIYADLFACAVGSEFNIQSIQIAKSLEKLENTPGRMNPISGKNDIRIIDDTYNANPTSVLAAAKTLEAIGQGKRRVMILGNMNELGKTEKEDHNIVASELKKTEIEKIVLAGPYAKDMAEIIGDRAIGYNSPAEIVRDIDGIVSSGDVVLVKASQNNNYFEEITKLLMTDSSVADTKLVRQSKDWMRKKRSVYKHIK